MIALDVACRMEVGVLAVMQKMYIVHGKPAFESTFVSAAVDACGRYSPLRAKCNNKTGDDYGYYAVATELSTGEELVGTTIDWKMVKAEGWDKDKPIYKNGQKTGVQRSKWNTMPDQMFKYRAKSFWKNEFEPGITMGIRTIDEIEDIGPAVVVGAVNPSQPQTKTIRNMDRFRQSPQEDQTPVTVEAEVMEEDQGDDEGENDNSPQTKSSGKPEAEVTKSGTAEPTNNSTANWNDLKTEIWSLATQLWDGKYKAESELNILCAKKGFSLQKMDEKQASLLIDALNKEIDKTR
jgi:hypothetical protein